MALELFKKAVEAATFALPINVNLCIVWNHMQLGLSSTRFTMSSKSEINGDFSQQVLSNSDLFVQQQTHACCLLVAMNPSTLLQPSASETGQNMKKNYLIYY